MSPVRRFDPFPRPDRRPDGPAQDERGVALVWMALFMFVLLVFAGFAVDLTNWYLNAERVQRAADAGAHAGVVFLPADLTSATSKARAETAKNGYTSGGSGASGSTITVTQEPNPNRLRVKVSTDVPNFFLGLIGLRSTRVSQESVAEYVAPVPMGSPQNKLGNDPEGTDPGTQLWVNAVGPSTGKQQGERYGSKLCNASPREFGCSSSSSTEYATDGYLYAIDVKSVVPGQPLTFQVFDGNYVNTGSTCDRTFRNSNGNTVTMMPTAASLTTTQWNALVAKFPDAATRYGAPSTAGAAAFCPGDAAYAGSNPVGNVSTTYIVRSPDTTEWSDTDNPVVSSGTCSPVTMGALNPTSSTNIYDQLMGASSGVVNPNDGVLTFAETFHRFATVCSIPAGSVQPGRYILQVRTNATSAAPTVYSSSVATEGANHFSIRVGFGSAGLTAVDGSNVTVSARGRLPIFANASGANTQFYVARVLPYDAGRTLRINLFDMGESSQAGTLRVLGPTEYTGTVSGCTISRDDNASLNTTPSLCQLNNVLSSGGYNGRLLTIDVPIPTNYTCNSASPTGCWMRIQASYPVGASVNDATTWSASILGNPVRLVE